MNPFLETIYSTIRPALPDLILILALVIIAVLGIKIIDHVSLKLRKKGSDQLRVKLITGSIQTLFIAVILIIMLSRIGLTEDFIKLIGLVVGGIVAFSSTSLITNLVGSAIIHITKPFAIGDVIQIGEQYGKVSNVSPVFTVIHTFQKTYTSVPNSSFLKEKVVNYSREGFRTTAKLTLGYDMDHGRAEDVLVKAAKMVRLQDVFVSVIGLEDHAVTYEVNGTCHEPESMPFIASRLRKSILDEFGLAKMEIASPTIIAHRTTGKILPKTKARRVRQQLKEEAKKTKEVVKDTFGKAKKKK